MANVIEFYMQMKDMMSSGIAAIARNARTGFGQVQSTVQRVQSAIAGAARQTGGLTTAFGRMRDAAESAANSTRGLISRMINAVRELRRARQEASDTADAETESGSSNRGFMSSGASLLRRLAPALGLAGIMSFAGKSVNAAMNFGATTKTFEVLTGSRTQGVNLANSLNKLQQETILGPEVFKAAQTLMSFGVAADKVVKIEKQLGDVSMGNAERFEALTLAFAQTQAAGRLMGQDLLQYINAGFNPLQTISERWKEFGLTSKKSVGELKEMMEKGQISAAAVAKAFEFATSKGGKFANMMEVMGDTAYGRMQVLQGQFENFKISVGNALLPVASELMEVASKTLDWLTITKTAPEVLMAENAEIATLVKTITQYNQGSELRHGLLTRLIAKYPDLFKGIDAEKVKNEELLSILNDINKAYQGRIELAQSDLLLSTNKKLVAENQSEWIRNAAIAEALKMGNTAAAKAMMKPSERFSNWISGLVGNDPTRLFVNQGEDARQALNTATKQVNYAQQKKDVTELAQLFTSAYALRNSGEAQKKLGANYPAFMQEMNNVGALLKQSGGKVTPSYLNRDFSKLKSFLAPSAIQEDTKLITDGKKGKGGSGSGSDVARGITSGGPRVINISGVKFMDKLELHTATFKEGVEDMEKVLEEMFLRLLNSGAKVQ